MNHPNTLEISFAEYGVSNPPSLIRGVDLIDDVVIRRRARSDLPFWRQGLVLLGYMTWPSRDANQRRHEWMRAHQLFDQWGEDTHRVGRVRPGFVAMQAVTKTLRSRDLRELYEEFERNDTIGLGRASKALQTLVDLTDDPSVGLPFGPSLRSAFGLTADRTTRPDEPKGADKKSLTAKSFEAAWSEFGAVAPFGAATHTLRDQTNRRLREKGNALFQIENYDAVFTAPDAVLMLAKAYQTFLSNFISHGRHSSLLPVNSWTIPESLGIRAADLPRYILNEVDHAFLARRRRA